MTKAETKKRVARVARSATGRPRRFTEEQILEVALEIMERDGFDALTLSSLAAQLKVSHSVLYKYVGNIEALEARAIDHLVGAIPMPRAGTAQQLREQTMATLLIVRGLLLKHPRVLNPPIDSAARDTLMESVVQWVHALTPFARDTDAAVIGHSVLIFTVAQSAEAERVHGQQALAKVLKNHDRRLPKPKSLKQVLDHLIDVHFPGLPKSGASV